MPSIPLIRSGIVWCEKGGATTRNAVIRTEANKRTSSQDWLKGSSTSRSADQRGYPGKELVGEGDGLGDHPVPAHHQGHGHGDCLGHEGESGFLKLGDGLQEGNREAHH